MTKKNFRDIKKVPSLVECIGCGIGVESEDLEKYHWYIINKDRSLCCCPNCDVTVVEK